MANDKAQQDKGRSGAKSEARNQVMKDFEELVEQADRLRQSTSELAGEEYAELRHQIDDALKRVRSSLDRTESGMVEQGIAARQWAEDCARKHPWYTVAAASGIGFLLGLLARR